MKKFKLLKSILVSMFGITTSFGTFTSIASCGNNSASKDEEKKDDEGGKEKNVKVRGVTLDSKSLILDPTDTKKLVATIDPPNATDKSVIWSSSDSSIAVVSNDGQVKANKIGEATIRVKTNDGGYYFDCQVIVRGIILNESSVELEADSSTQLIATVYPERQQLIWASLDESIATVDRNGIISAKKAGTTRIKVETSEGQLTNYCSVSVYEKYVRVERISFDISSIEMPVGDTKRLTAKIEPENATNKQIAWSSSKDEVVTVDASGQITARKEGDATITAFAKDGEGSRDGQGIFKATLTVKVYPRLDISKYCILEAFAETRVTIQKHRGCDNIPNFQYAKYIDGQKPVWTTIFNDNLATPIHLQLSVGEIYLFKGKNSSGFNIYNEVEGKWDQGLWIIVDGNESAYLYGTITALLNDGGDEIVDTIPNYCFDSLFRGSNGLWLIGNKFLPSTNLGLYCYQDMFYYCYSLTRAPDLPATTLSKGCYKNMFCLDSSLTSIKIMYTDTYDNAPLDAFSDWAGSVAENGSFYYNGKSSAQDFGLPNGWLKKTF